MRSDPQNRATESGASPQAPPPFSFRDRSAACYEIGASAARSANAAPEQQHGRKDNQAARTTSNRSRKPSKPAADRKGQASAQRQSRAQSQPKLPSYDALPLRLRRAERGGVGRVRRRRRVGDDQPADAGTRAAGRRQHPHRQESSRSIFRSIFPTRRCSAAAGTYTRRSPFRGLKRSCRRLSRQLLSAGVVAMGRAMPREASGRSVQRNPG